MRRVYALVLAAALSLSSTGCFVNMWASDPNHRMVQMLVWSENLRQIQGEWDRFWFNDQPSHLTPVAIHGGIQPGF